MMLLQLAFAGGILTNYNQSAQYIRMLSRNASLDVDAVFYNPAGLIKLNDGWHFSFSSQTIWQTREVTSNFPLLMNDHDNYYEGKTFAPVFPDFYGVYKKNKWAFSLGVGPAAGGGSAEFENGLPSFEIPISKLGSGLGQLSPLFNSYQIPSVNGYSIDMSFEASSIFWGIQLGASYAINDMISVYGGVRVMPSINTYDGTISNISVLTSQGNLPADNYLALVKPVLDGTINSIDQASSGLQAAIGAGLVDGNASVSNPEILQLLGAFGITDVTNQEAVYAMEATNLKLGIIRDADVTDKEVDSKQTGIGFTPIISVNISPNDDWNIALKYEHRTTLKLTNDTKVDDMGLFPDGAESRNDVPGLIAAGVGYRGLDWMEVQLSYNYFLDKGVDWGYNVRYNAVGEAVHREIDKNTHEVALGLQFNLTDNFALSVGGLYLSNGVAESFHSDFSYNNGAYAIAGGLEWKITDRLTFDAGLSQIAYQEEEVTFLDPDIGNYTDIYGKNAFMFGAGVSVSIF